ncbi:hypothetical protein FRC12_014893 [Ceratobasidium sp. 428]|nr:hypothetical protein FRC12_014893 [Ceratobasidium sp. 428]
MLGHVDPTTFGHSKMPTPSRKMRVYGRSFRSVASATTGDNCTYFSTNKFLDQAIPNDRNHPGYTAGQLAQSVQRSEFPGRYDEAKEKAQTIIKNAKASVGGREEEPAE